MKTLCAAAAFLLLALPARADTARADLVDAHGKELASVTVADLAPEDGSVRMMLATIKLAQAGGLGEGAELAPASNCGAGGGTLLVPQADLAAQGAVPALPMPAAGRQKAEFILPDTDVRTSFLSRQKRALSLRRDGVQIACALFEAVPDSALETAPEGSAAPSKDL